MKSFTELFDDCTSQGIKIKTDEYLESGAYAVVDQGQNDIAGYTNIEDGVYTDVPAIIFGDHTRVIKYIDVPFFLGADGVKLLKAKDEDANYKYLYYALRNAGIPNTGYNRHFKWLKEVKIQCPDKEKQSEIVDVLEKTEKVIDDKKQQLEQLALLIKARFVEMFENGKYPKVKVSEVCDFITKGTTPPTGEIYDENSDTRVPFLKVYNLSFTGELLFYENAQFIERAVHDGKLARSKVYPNDVLTNIVGPPLGKFSIVPDEYPELNINQAIAIFRAKEKVLPRYLLSALMQPEVLRPFIDQAVGIRQQNLSLEQCRNLEIALPDLEIQRNFVMFSKQVDKSKFDNEIA